MAARLLCFSSDVEGSPRPAPDAPRPVRIVGCQPYEVLERGRATAGITRRST